MYPVLNATDIDRLTGGRMGIFDCACPVCGPHTSSRTNAVRKVLRIWRRDADFAGYDCKRCDIKGGVRLGGTLLSSGFGVKSGRIAGTIVPDNDNRKRVERARTLAAHMKDPNGSPVEHYLRDVRKYNGVIPATVGYLPAYGEHPHRMIAVYGFPTELEPGVLRQPEVIEAVHVTCLKTDGSGKLGDQPKRSYGLVAGKPIVLAPMTDLLGLIICEGIETGLSLYEATGCGVWAAGGKAFLPALAERIPEYTDCVTIAAERGAEREAAQLLHKTCERGIDCRIRYFDAIEANRLNLMENKT